MANSRNSVQQPRILACYHTFCSHCLQLYISQQTPQDVGQAFLCPVCACRIAARKGSEVTSRVDELKQDTFTLKLSEVLEALRDMKKCDICRRRDVEHGASDWCMDCYDGLCEDCTKIHLCGKTTSEHVVISMSELQKMSLENIMRRTSAERCARHRDDVVKLFCLDCGQPVCVQCLALSHRKCERCVPVSEARKLVDDDVADVLTRLQAAATQGNNDRTPIQNGANSLEENIKQTEAEIRSLAEDLRRRITVCEEEMVEQLHCVSSQLRGKSSSAHTTTKAQDDDVKILTSAHSRMMSLLTYGSDLDVLDIYHHVKDTLSRTNGKGSASAIEDTVSLKVSFDIDETLTNFCRDFQTLGDIRVEDLARDEGLSSWGVTVTPHDEIVVTDGRHNRIQKFSSSGTLVDHIQLQEEPRDVVSFGQDDIAITIMKKQILIVTVSGSLDLKRRVDTLRQYDGIAFYPALRYFLVSSLEENCIDIITTRGDITKSFNVNASTLEPTFSCPRYVTFTKEGHLVVSDAAHSSVTVISHDGTLLFTYAPRDGAQALKNAQGVCCDKDGNMFVADYSNSRVHLLTSGGHFQRFILGRNSQLCRPVAVAMTASNKLVVVQSDGTVKIFSYEGNKDDGNPGTPNGKVGPSRPRFHSSTSARPFRVGLQGTRSLSESSEARSPTSTLSPHTFRSRHF